MGLRRGDRETIRVGTGTRRASPQSPVLAVVSREHDTQIWAAPVNGLVVALDRAGKVIARARLPGYADHLASHPDGTAILVASADGHMACYDVEQGDRDVSK